MSEVAGNRVELLFLLPELLVELLCVMRLRLECLLAACLVIETSRMQVALFNHVTISAELVVHMSTNEVHCGQFKFLVASIAIFLVKVFAGALHTLDVFPHRVDALRHLLYTRALHFAGLPVHFTLEV